MCFNCFFSGHQLIGLRALAAPFYGFACSSVITGGVT